MAAVRPFDAAAATASELMGAVAAVPNEPFTAQGWAGRDVAVAVPRALDIGRALLLAGLHGEWAAPFPRDGRLVLLKADDADGTLVRHGRGAYMVLLRPAAFLAAAAADTDVRDKGDADDSRSPAWSLRPPTTDAAAASEFSLVTFVGWRKADLGGSAELWVVEAGLMADLRAAANVHLYVVLPLPDGRNYVNVVLGRPLRPGEGPMALMGASAWHRRAVAVASLYSYRWVRIHSGTFVGDVPRRRGRVHLHRTLCIAFAPGMPADAPGALLAAREDAATRRIPEAAAGACPFGGTGVVWRRALPRDESFLPFGADAAGWLPSNVLATLGLPAW